MTGFVYQLTNPANNDVIYIGSTIMSHNERRRQHIYYSRFNDSPVHKYLRENKITPDISVIETVEYHEVSELREREKFWIRTASMSGLSLKNGVTYKSNIKYEGGLVISVRPPNGDLKRELEELAAETGESMNFHAVKAIEQYLVKSKTKSQK